MQNAIEKSRNSMNKDDVSKLSSIVPELWHDLIARIIPGFLILCSVNGRGLDAFKEVTFVQFTGAFLFAYLIGLTADLLSDILFRVIPWYKNQRIDFYKKIDQHQPPYRDLMVKMFAEAVFFRSLSFYSLLQFIYEIYATFSSPMSKILSPILDMPPPIKFCPLIASLLLLIIFIACWIRIMRNAIERLNSTAGERVAHSAG